jgi:hypothetical protein
MQQVAIGFLRVIAWLSLIGGVFGGVIFFALAANTNQALRAIPGVSSQIGNQGLGLAALVTVAMIYSGIFTWALLLVVADIGENLSVIRHNTRPAPPRRRAPVEDYYVDQPQRRVRRTPAEISR